MMKRLHFALLFLFFISLINIHCTSEKEVAILRIKSVVYDTEDQHFGSYLVIKPAARTVKGILLLLPGFGQNAEDIFLDTNLHQLAFENDILTIGFAGKMRLTADSLIQEKINAVLQHAAERAYVDKENFFIGGFSAGGTIALRYAELCKQFPERFPLQPKAVFMADAPIDFFHSWKMHQSNIENNFSEIAVREAEWVGKSYRHYYGATPDENPELFAELSPFSMDTKLGTNERFLKDVAVRAYHDVDIAWRLKNRNQTVRHSNFIATSELINRLQLLGNKKAEFVQTFQTGYRRNGERHPHSWSIIDETECIEWLMSLME